MKVLVIGGTRFIGASVVRGLAEAGHDVTVFHRGGAEADLPLSVRHAHGDRRELARYAPELARLAPEVVVDMFSLTEADAAGAVRAFSGVARRLVMISSADVYRAYGLLRGDASGPPEPLPLSEDAALRDELFPYRAKAKGPDDWLRDYDKILVERAAAGDPALPATILRLPMVYGPGDYQHRLFPYLKRMDDHRPAILFEEGAERWRTTRGYVEDVAAAVVLAATDDRAAGRTYNVGDPEALAEREWVRAIGRATGWSGRLVSLPREDLPEALRTDLAWEHDLVIDTTRIREELGYAERVPRDEAIARTVAWERTHPPEGERAPRFDYPAEDAASARARLDEGPGDRG